MIHPARTAGLVLLLLAFQEPEPRPAPGSASRSAAEWNELGIEHLEARRYDAAVEAFAAARARAPADPVFALNLSRSHAHRGGAAHDAGRLLDALRDFEKAAAAQRDGGVPEVLAARVQLQLGAREEARRVLAAVCADFPDNEEALRWAAEVEALSGRLDQAVALLEAALERHPGLQQRCQQLREEKRAWDGFLTDSSSHFDVRYDPWQQAVVDALPALVADLEAAYQAVVEKLGWAPSDRILVLLLDRARYEGQAPEWSGGLYDGRIRLPVGDYAREQAALRATLRHEYTHAALHRLGPPLPTWLQEGMAQLVEGRPAEQARVHLRQSASVPELAALHGDWTAWEDRAKVRSAYQYALSFCAYFGEVYGPTSYRLLFENLRNLGFEEGFRRTFAKSLEDMEAEHRSARLAPG